MTILVEMPKKDKKEIIVGGLVTEIKHHHGLFQESARMTVRHAIKVGILLIQAKRQVGHGNFTTWITASCPFKPRMAEFYMQVARRRKELEKLKSKSIADLTLSGATKLLQQSNRPNKNRNNKDRNNKDPLPKETGKLAAAASKSCLETKHVIERLDERGGKGFWAKDDPAVARFAKRAEDLLEALSDYLGKRQ